MNVNLEVTIDQNAFNKNVVILELEEILKEEFINKKYGKDVETVSIKINIVNPPEGFEHLYKEQKPKYIDEKIVKNIYTGENITFIKHFFFCITIIGEEYHNFINSSDLESKQILLSKILSSLTNLKLPQKIKDFNFELFKKDIKILGETVK